MLKTTFIGISLISILSVSALAADAVTVQPGTGPTDTMTKAVPEMKPAAGQPSTAGSAKSSEAAPVGCTQTEITAMITKAGALTDKDKQKMTMGHLESAKKSMDLKDTESCTMHLREASANLGTGTVTK
jgi:hypothetical protein